MINHIVSHNCYEVIEALHNGVIIVDQDGVIIMCNTSGSELLNVDKEEIIGKHITEVVEGSLLQRVAKEGVAFPNQKYKIKNRDMLANLSPLIKDGMIIGAISVFQDATDLHNTLSLLDEKEKEVLQLKEILELLYDGIIMVDSQGIVTMINQTYCDFLGVNINEVIGKHVTEVVENTRMHIVVKTGKPEIGSVMSVGDKKIIVMRTPIWKDNKVIGAIGKVLYTDISQLKTLAQRLNVAESTLDFYKQELKRVRGAKYSFEQIIGDHEKMREAKDLARKVANSRSTVLIRGESGTGKELFAHAIHEASNRSDGPLIRINCAAIPANIIEAELFGYEEGAFTGAKKGGKPGKIEQAQGGTLFLDEVGDMPLDMQVKLLRVLQEKEVERIGGTQLNQIDIRVIAATNRPLEEMVKSGQFREDLYYRLNVFHILIPPLRERGPDVITTAQLILGEINSELGTSISGFQKDVEELLSSYHWPGNVREMQNVIERSIHLAVNGSQICLEHLPPYLLVLTEGQMGSSTHSLEKEVEQAEKNAIKRALQMTQGNRSKAADLLEIHRASLYRKMEKYDIVD
jgi:PAS domain S-box-containing protein